MVPWWTQRGEEGVGTEPDAGWGGGVRGGHGIHPQGQSGHVAARARGGHLPGGHGAALPGRELSEEESGTRSPGIQAALLSGMDTFADP